MDLSKVELLLPMRGANNGTVFTDSGLRKRTVRVFGNAKTVTAQSKFAAYGSSGAFDGTGDVLEAPFAAIGTKLRASPFCYEMWVRPANVNGVKSLINLINPTGRNNAGNHDLTTNDNSTQGNFFIFDDAIAFFRATGSTTAAAVFGTISLVAGTWAHTALSWDLTMLRLFVNGVADTSSTTWHDNAAPTLAQIYSIAGWFNGTNRNNQNYNGHMQDLCITIGEAKYTSNFTPPPRMTQRTLTRVNVGTDSHESERVILFDWDHEANPGRIVIPDSSGNFVANNLFDSRYGAVFTKEGFAPICRGPYNVD